METNCEKVCFSSSDFFFSPINCNNKNTTKEIEDEIFTAKENIRILKTEFENVSLEYDYLSSSERLLEYQSQYFEDDLIQKNIKDIRVYNFSNDVNKIQNFKIIKE